MVLNLPNDMVVLLLYYLLFMSIICFCCVAADYILPMLPRIERLLGKLGGISLSREDKRFIIAEQTQSALDKLCQEKE